MSRAYIVGHNNVTRHAVTLAMASKSEISYIQSSLLADEPLRTGGRSLLDFRSIQLETGVVMQTNGSARVNIGGTEIIAACKLEVEDVDSGEGVDGGHISCAVSCSPSAYPHLSPSSLDELQYDFSQVLNSVISDKSLRPSNLTIIPGRKSWLINLDCIVLSDAGNVYDALFIVARAALCDSRVPMTRPIEYKAPQKASGDIMDESGLDTRQATKAADFELRDYWSDGEILEGNNRWPLCITMNLISSKHFLDATSLEDAAVPLRLLLIFSCPSSQSATLQGIRLLGSGEMAPSQTKTLLEAGEKYAKELFKTIDAALSAEQARTRR
ncbi:hypothetical protein M422DRAFT_155461 [Sphaerobolus stellatus SS14]|nr:hypothetical protein M422DRAFT_155461 [Sphaerobolus stellatus SS14]